MRCILESSTFEGASRDKNGTSYTQYCVYSLDSVDDVNRFETLLPRPGRGMLSNPVRFIQRVELVPDFGTQPTDGRYFIGVRYHLGAERVDGDKDAEGNPINENTPPWLYKPENIQTSTSSEEYAPTTYYPTAYQNVLPAAQTPVPFVNTAGVPILATTTRNLMTLSFSYNVRRAAIQAGGVFVNSVNLNPCAVCGEVIGRRCGRLDAFDVEHCEEMDANGCPRWQYDKVSVQITINPRTWNQEFLNVGQHVRLNDGGLRRIWSWVDSTGKTCYGDLYNGQKAGFGDTMEEVAEPMFLTPDGSNISPFDADGRQIPTYISGCLQEPLDWQLLQLPPVR